MVTKPNSNKARLKRHARVRAKISGTAACPRLDVFRSNSHIYAQLIDDVNGVTLAAAASNEKDFAISGGNCEGARKVGQLIAARAAEKGIHVINIDYIFGFRSMMTNKLIETPEDMKGLKIRTPGSELYVNTINCMGATATPMGFADTISAVQQGVVDGLEGTIDAYNSNGSAEVAKQMALTKHLLGVCGAYINEDLWNSIPEEYRTIMQEEFDAGAERMVKKITESEAEIMKKLEAEKGITFNEVDSEAFKALVLPIYEEMVAKKGVTPGLYERFQEIIAEMP